MRICPTCKKELSIARLLAKPDAVQCVPCLAANGDELLVTAYQGLNHASVSRTLEDYRVRREVEGR